jgi:hypothetical protein
MKSKKIKKSEDKKIKVKSMAKEAKDEGCCGMEECEDEEDD